MRKFAEGSEKANKDTTAEESPNRKQRRKNKIQQSQITTKRSKNRKLHLARLKARKKAGESIAVKAKSTIVNVSDEDYTKVSMDPEPHSMGMEVNVGSKRKPSLRESLLPKRKSYKNVKTYNERRFGTEHSVVNVTTSEPKHPKTTIQEKVVKKKVNHQERNTRTNGTKKPLMITYPKNCQEIVNIPKKQKEKVKARNKESKEVIPTRVLPARKARAQFH